MSATHCATGLKKIFWAAAIFALGLASGCATTTTASLQSSVHAADSFRFQSADVTALVQVEFRRE